MREHDSRTGSVRQEDRANSESATLGVFGGMNLMTLDEYQIEAARTDKQKGRDREELIVPLLGLAGEAGSLLTLYKKWIRDGDDYQILHSRIADELGDVIWYFATIARKAG